MKQSTMHQTINLTIEKLAQGFGQKTKKVLSRTISLICKYIVL